MNGYTFLAVSIVIAVLGIGFYYLGPVLERWHKRLEADLKQLKRRKSSGDDSAGRPQ